MSVDPRPRRRWPVRLLLAVGLIVWGASLWQARVERTLHLRLECEGSECRASVNEGEWLTVETPAVPSGRIGFYMFHPYEWRGQQTFRNLEIDSDGSTESFVLPLLETRDRAELVGARGWTIDGGRGLTHAGRPGQRALTLVDQRTFRDFRLDVDLVATLDAGVAFRAAGVDDTMLFIARSKYNDAFFCRVENGRVGPILAFMPLGELQAGRELLRVAGLVAGIGLAGALFLWLFRVTIPLLPPLRQSGARWRRWIAGPRPGAAVLVALFCVTLAAHAAVGWWGLDGIPHLQDETAYLFQAKIFAQGALWAPAPEQPEFFLHEHLILVGDRWFSKYPPLFSLLLAVGVSLGAPFLVNPLLGALTGLVTYALAREISDWRWGLVAWLFVLASPFFVIMGGTLLSHMSAALFLTSFLYFVVRGTKRGSIACAFGAAASLGLALFTRPFAALLFCLAVGLYYLVGLFRRDRRRLAFVSALLLALVVLPFAGGYLGWNRLLAGPEVDSYNLHELYNPTDRLGFGADKGSDWLKTWGSHGHTPAKALRSVHMYLDYTSRHLLGWPGRLSFALVLAGLLWARRRAPVGLLVGALAALALGHTFYWATQHLAYGARYWFSAVPALMVVSSLGLRELLQRTREQLVRNDPDRPASGRLAWAAVPLLALVMANFMFYFPARFAELHQFSGVTADLKREVETRQLHNVVVFIETRDLWFNDGFFMNDPLAPSGRVFARDLGPRNATLLESYPDHQAWRWRDGRLELLERSR